MLDLVPLSLSLAMQSTLFARCPGNVTSGMHRDISSPITHQVGCFAQYFIEPLSQVLDLFWLEMPADKEVGRGRDGDHTALSSTFKLAIWLSVFSRLQSCSPDSQTVSLNSCSCKGILKSLPASSVSKTACHLASLYRSA